MRVPSGYERRPVYVDYDKGIIKHEKRFMNGGTLTVTEGAISFLSVKSD